jgi:hypothetical protein
VGPPLIGVYLMTEHGWDAASIGAALSERRRHAAGGLAVGAYPVFSNSSRPMSMRRISLVPAPIS